MKTCIDCGKHHLLNEFPIAKKATKTKRRILEPRCLQCHRKMKKEKASKARLAKRREQLFANEELRAQGKRICALCFDKKSLSEFGTSQQGGKGKINKICDSCLSKRYAYKGDASFNDPRYWRRRAYATNTAARNRMNVNYGSKISLSELSWICKPQDLARLFKKQDGCCAYCGVKLTPIGTIRSFTPTALTVDHWKPMCIGGKHTRSNLLLACHACNALKGTLPGSKFIEFMHEYAKRIMARFRAIRSGKVWK